MAKKRDSDFVKEYRRYMDEYNEIKSILKNIASAYNSDEYNRVMNLHKTLMDRLKRFFLIHVKILTMAKDRISNLVSSQGK